MGNSYYRGNNYKSNFTPPSKKSNNGQTLRVIITAAVINLIAAAIIIAISFLLIRSSETREMFIKLVFLPTTAFVGAFFSLFFYKKLLLNIAGGAIIWLAAFWIFVEFSLWGFTWIIFYAANALLGSMAAFIARTFK